MTQAFDPEHSYFLSGTMLEVDSMSVYDFATMWGQLYYLIRANSLFALLDDEFVPWGEEEQFDTIDAPLESLVNSFELRSVSMHSPVEWVSYISAGSVATWAVANRILSVHDRYQRSRLLRAETNAKVRAFEILINSVDTESNAKRKVLKARRYELDQAARALEQIDSLKLTTVPPRTIVRRRQ